MTGAPSHGSSHILAIGLSGPLGNLVAVDGEGRRTWPRAPIWEDRRPETVAGTVRQRFSAGELDAWLGTHLPAVPSWPLERLWWLKTTYPDQWHRVAKVASLKDYMGFRLTGTWVTDASGWRGQVHFPDGAAIPQLLEPLALALALADSTLFLRKPQTSRGAR